MSVICTRRVAESRRVGATFFVARISLPLYDHKSALIAHIILVHFPPPSFFPSSAFAMAKPRNFLELPLELRQSVYGVLFHRKHNEPRNSLTHLITPEILDKQNTKVHLILNLLLTSRQIYLEATVLFYGHYTFRFTNRTSETLMNWLVDIGPRNRSLLRHLHLDFSSQDGDAERTYPSYRWPGTESWFQELFHLKKYGSGLEELAEHTLDAIDRACGERNVKITLYAHDYSRKISNVEILDDVVKRFYADHIRDKIWDLFDHDTFFMRFAACCRNLQSVEVADEQGRDMEYYKLLERSETTVWFWERAITGLRDLKRGIEKAKTVRREVFAYD